MLSGSQVANRPGIAGSAAESTSAQLIVQLTVQSRPDVGPVLVVVLGVMSTFKSQSHF